MGCGGKGGKGLNEDTRVQPRLSSAPSRLPAGHDDAMMQRGCDVTDTVTEVTAINLN